MSDTCEKHMIDYYGVCNKCEIELLTARNELLESVYEAVIAFQDAKSSDVYEEQQRLKQALAAVKE